MTRPGSVRPALVAALSVLPKPLDDRDMSANARIYRDVEAAIATLDASGDVGAVYDLAGLKRLWRIGVDTGRLLERHGVFRSSPKPWHPPMIPGYSAVLLPPPADPLPEGLFIGADGRVSFTCRGCDQTTPLEGDVEEFHPGGAYCGGSPRCIP